MVFFWGIIFISILTNDFLLQFQLTLVPDFFFFLIQLSLFALFPIQYFDVFIQKIDFHFCLHIFILVIIPIFILTTTSLFLFDEVKLKFVYISKLSFHFKLIFMLRNKIQHLDYIPAASRITHASNFRFSQSQQNYSNRNLYIITKIQKHII